MLLNVRLKEKKSKMSRQRYKEKSELIVLDSSHALNQMNEDLLSARGVVSHLPSLPQSNLISPAKRNRSHNRHLNSLSF